jgi:arylsulfatase A-like enzyme
MIDHQSPFRIRFLNPICIIRSFLFCSLLFCGSIFGAQKPNIILMVADDLGWGDVGYHTSEIKTPNIDALAARGVQLDQFYVQPVCTPTRGALMTGRYPIRLGLQCGVVRPWADHGLPLDEQTLPSGLKTAGYKTAIVGKWHLGHSKPEYLPTHRGFDQQYGHYNGALNYFTHDRDGGHDWHRNDQRSDDEGYTTDLLGDEAARIIKQHDTDQPLFLYVPFNAPHSPIQATDNWIKKYEHITEKNRRIYAAMVASMDAAIGKIIAAADEHLSMDNTILFFCSDNGGMLMFGSNNELRGQKGRLFEGGVRVPALIAWDGKLAAGTKVTAPLHIVDLYPTLLGLAGAEVDQAKPLDGRDAWPTIAGGAPTPHKHILLNANPFHGALREGDWKIIHNSQLTANATELKGKESWELFNIAKDPSEKTDLATKYPELLARLRTKLEAVAAEAVTPNIPPNKAPANFKVPAVWGE